MDNPSPSACTTSKCAVPASDPQNAWKRQNSKRLIRQFVAVLGKLLAEFVEQMIRGALLGNFRVAIETFLAGLFGVLLCCAGRRCRKQQCHPESRCQQESKLKHFHFILLIVDSGFG